MRTSINVTRGKRTVVVPVAEGDRIDEITRRARRMLGCGGFPRLYTFRDGYPIHPGVPLSNFPGRTDFVLIAHRRIATAAATARSAV